MVSSSATSNSDMENITLAQRNQMALKYGVLAGFIYILIFTGVGVLVGNFIAYNAMRLVGYVLYMVIFGVFATQIRKANGGYLEFKDTFGAVFVMILAANVLYFIYSYVYFKVINPHFLEQMKGSVMTFMENMHAPDDKIEKSMHDFDQQIAESQSFNLSKTLMGFFGFLILDSLFGMLVAVIVRKKVPMFNP